jgi:hypothetical protein
MMKKFVFGVICAMLVSACGGEATVAPPDPEPEDQCEGMVPADHEHPDMVPAIHDHPDAEPVGALDATGHYLTEFLLTGNSCDEGFAFDPEAWGPDWIWSVMALQDTYIFSTIGDFALVSEDGSLFTLVIEVAPEDSWYCEGGELYEFEATLEFTELDISGDYTKHYVGWDCPRYDDEGNYISEDFDCIITWDLRGVKQ